MDESCSRHEFKECAKQVTALIPLYNQEKYLERFFSSIKKLLEYGCQIDISDNCSTDSSLRKTQAFAVQQAGDQIRIFRQNTNRGVVANNSYLWEHAKSPYVFFAHADDKYSEGFVRSVLLPYKQNPDLVLSMCQLAFMDEQEQPSLRPKKDTFLPNTQEMTRAEMLQFFMYGSTGLYIYGLFNKRKLDELGIPIAGLAVHPFWEYPPILACFLTGGVATVPETDFTYRLHINAATDSPHVDTHLTGPPVVTDGKPLHAHAARFIVRFWEVVDLYSPRGSLGKVMDKFWLLLGAWRSEGGSVNWYWRVKESLWRDLWTFAKRSEWKEFLILASFIPLKIRILRLLIKQRVF
jgi:glycosyltransferase involved in cell wall biosynthesis